MIIRHLTQSTVGSIVSAVRVLTNREGLSGVGAAISALRAGRSALDAVELGARTVEADAGVVSVGRGGLTDVLGNVTCDAAVMDGRTLEAGAVGCLSGYLHAVSVARQVMRRLPHVFLVGAGADRFAAEIKAERAEMLTAENQARYRRWLARHVPESKRSQLEHGPLARYAWESTRKAGGTVVFLAIDRKGNLAGATSTSGWAYRYPGRLGDSPVIGAGLYVDNRYGACGCTHVGEMTIRCSTARSVVLYLKGGASVEEAVAEAMADLNDLRYGFTGAVMIHAMDSDGRACVLSRTDVKDKRIDHFWPGRGRPTTLRAPVARR
jgi:L-asparaginase / beta-aspartyl-peptidase